MSRRSTPQQEIDRDAFPVHVRALIPEEGFGVLHDRISDWLARNLGRGEFAQIPHSSILGDSFAFLFRSTRDADAFMRAFPELLLADGTMSVTYASPYHPFGRRELEPICNLYSQTKAQEAMRQLFAPRPMSDRLGNLAPRPEIYPDQMAPIVRADGEGLVLQMARWGLPTPPQYLAGKKTDRGVTNVRNVRSPHWRRWLDPVHRCLVPFDAFAEPDQRQKGNVWFRVKDDRPAFFAGIFVPGWTSVRRVKDGETTDDLFAFLTCAPNAVVGEVHPKAMPVILTEPEEWEIWLTASFDTANELQRPLPEEKLAGIDTG